MSHCCNYCDCLFSLNGAAPRHLPGVIRLENGQTRNIKFVSIEDINSLGYVGPIPVPEYDKQTEYLLWNPNTVSFSIQERSSPYTQAQISDLENYKVRFYLEEESESIREKLLDSSLTDVGTLAYVERYKYITQLLASTDNLSFSDVERFVDNVAYNASEMNKIQAEFEITYPSYSGCYHHFGFIPGLGQNGLSPETFKVNKAWTQNLDPNIHFTIFPSLESSPGLVEVSGYNMLTGDNTYEIIPGETRTLMFGSVFYPND